MEFVLLYLVYGVVLGSFCAYLAGQKGRDGTSWFFLGLVFGILALLVLIGLPGEQHSSSENRPHTRPPVTSSTDRNVTGKPPDVRLCPHCIQEVHELAAACPHCQRDLPEVERCSLPSCRKIINQTDDRCEDGQENTFCGDLHRQQYVGPRHPILFADI